MPLPVVLIHAFPFDAALWANQAAFLRARGREVLMPNMPGFGHAAALPKEKCSMEAFAGQVRELIMREAGGRAIVGGISMGGYVTLALVREYPELVAGVMLMDTRAEADTAEVRAGRMAAIKTVEEGGLEPVAEAMLGRVLSRFATAEVRERAREMILRQSRAGVMGAQWAMAHRTDQTALLSEIRVPALVLVGAEDTVTPPGVAMGMHGLIAGSMLVQVARAGHMTSLEQPDAVNAALETFLATVGE